MSVAELVGDAFNGIYKGGWSVVSKSGLIRDLAMQTGPIKRARKRFIAGDMLADAISTAEFFNATGVSAVLDYVGEDVRTEDEAIAAKDTYLGILDCNQ